MIYFIPLKSLILSLVFLFLLPLVLCGQSNAKYFDDGNISNARHKVKLNLASAYVGDINLSYEYKINDLLGVEVGAGLLMPYYNELLTQYQVINEPEGGFSWHANIRWYYREISDSYALYAAPLIRQRNYKEKIFGSPLASEIKFRDIGLVQGFQASFSRLVVDSHAGFALRNIKIDEDDFEDGFSDDFVYIITLKVGYLF